MLLNCTLEERGRGGGGGYGFKWLKMEPFLPQGLTDYRLEQAQPHRWPAVNAGLQIKGELCLANLFVFLEHNLQIGKRATSEVNKQSQSSGDRCWPNTDDNMWKFNTVPLLRSFRILCPYITWFTNNSKDPCKILKRHIN